MRTLALLALGTMVLGAVLAVVKGRDYGLGYFVGNLSTPYLLAVEAALEVRWGLLLLEGVRVVVSVVGLVGALHGRTKEHARH